MGKEEGLKINYIQKMRKKEKKKKRKGNVTR